MNHETAALNQRLDDLTASLGQAMETLTARLEGLEERDEQRRLAQYRLCQRLDAVEPLAAKPPDPGDDTLEFLTRNHYRIMFVDRDPRRGRVGFRLIIDLAANAEFSLDAATFDNLVNDLGPRPTSPAATEYASVPLSETTEGRQVEHEKRLWRSLEKHRLDAVPPEPDGERDRPRLDPRAAPGGEG